MQKALDALKKRFPDCFQENEPLARHTSFRTGGPADLFGRPRTIAMLSAILREVRQHNLPLFLMGDGTNLLVRDGGIRGVVLSLTTGCKQMDFRKNRITAGCGTRLPRLCLAAARAGLSGMEGLCGIPGTVGGAIVMNAGTPKGAACDFLTHLTVAEKDGTIKEIDSSGFTFSYRHFAWTDKTPVSERILLSATWEMQQEDPAKLKAAYKADLARRKASQPKGAASAGCFFKNPPGDLAAGLLIDRAGLKGSVIGGAMVSPVHANFIVNQGDASAREILSLMEHVRHTVHQSSGIWLETEVRIVGEAQSS